MDRVLILIVLLVAVFIWLSKEGVRLSYDKFTEFLVSVYVFSCCFVRLSFPLYTLPFEHQFGPFGSAFRLEMCHIMIFILLWVISQRKNITFTKIKPLPLFILLFYILYTMLNPFNIVKSSSCVALNYILSYLVFMYLLTSCCSVENIIKGVYKGLSMTVILHFVLLLAYTLTGAYSIVVLLNADAVTRRGASPATFGHPNALGAYASFYLMFFVACFFTGFKKRDSLVYALIALFVIYMSASRSALMASAFGIMVLVVLYVFRKYSLFNVQILLKGVLPVGIVLLLLYIFTPLSDMFSASSDADDMVLARYMHYYCAYEIFSDHPLVGVGLNTHLKYLQENSALVDIETMFEGNDIWMPEDFMFTNPIHNIWLIMLTEFGLIGVIPIVSFIVYFYATFKKKIKESNSLYYNIAIITALGILSCMLVHGNSDWTLYTPTMLNISLFFLFIAETSKFSQKNITV